MPLSNTIRRLAAGALSLLAAITASTVSGMAAEGWPERVHAVYEISFNGIRIGGFEFNSATGASDYALSGSGKVSVLFGSFKWSGTADAKGVLGAREVKPVNFGFHLQGSAKSGTTRMIFAGDMLARIELTPQPQPKHDAIAVTPEHLRSVLDPLSAVMAITRGGPNPCSRRVPVHDGQRRLDIVMSPRGQVPLAIARPADQPTTGHVCRLTYRLIAGHRPGDENTYMTRNQNIEMILRPIPSANVYVPYEISAATLLGRIRIFARTVSLRKGGHYDIALSH